MIGHDYGLQILLVSNVMEQTSEVLETSEVMGRDSSRLVRVDRDVRRGLASADFGKVTFQHAVRERGGYFLRVDGHGQSERAKLCQRLVHVDATWCFRSAALYVRP